MRAQIEDAAGLAGAECAQYVAAVIDPTRPRPRTAGTTATPPARDTVQDSVGVEQFRSGSIEFRARIAWCQVSPLRVHAVG